MPLKQQAAVVPVVSVSVVQKTAWPQSEANVSQIKNLKYNRNLNPLQEVFHVKAKSQHASKHETTLQTLAHRSGELLRSVLNPKVPTAKE